MLMVLMMLLPVAELLPLMPPQHPGPGGRGRGALLGVADGQEEDGADREGEDALAGGRSDGDEDLCRQVVAVAAGGAAGAVQGLGELHGEGAAGLPRPPQPGSAAGSPGLLMGDDPEASSC